MRRTLPEKMPEASRLAMPFSGICFRNVAQRFATRRDMLSAQGSLLSGGRYNFHGTYSDQLLPGSSLRAINSKRLRPV